MSLNSLESEGLRPLHFLPFVHVATSSQLGPATGLRAKWLWCQKGGAILLFHEKQLQSMTKYSGMVWGRAALG